MAHSLYDSFSTPNKFHNSIDGGNVSRFLSPTHSEVAIREKLPCMRGKLCPNTTQGGTCDNRDVCDYSHNLEEVRMYNQNFKTKLCSFAINGGCKKANGCRYAHSLAELSAEANDESPSPSKGWMYVDRNISTVSTQAETSELANRMSSSSLLELPASPKYSTHFTSAITSPIIVPPSSHYVDHLNHNRQGKYRVPRNVRISNEAVVTMAPPYFSPHLFYNPSRGIYQPIPMDSGLQREVYED